MPPRKRKGRGKKAPGGGAKKKVTSEEVQDEGQIESEAAESVDTQLLEAQSTIERLAKKYLHESFETSSQSLDVIKSDSIVMKEPVESDNMDILSVDTSENEHGGKENELSLTDVSREAVASPQAKPILRKRKASFEKSPSVILRRVRRPRASKTTGDVVKDKKTLQEKQSKKPFVSPGFKIPQPKLGHSTPGGDATPIAGPRRDSLFGFEVLESPLVLSPVPSMAHHNNQQDARVSPEQKDSPEQEKRKSLSFKRLIGTYDIPFRKPTPKNKKRSTKQKNKRSSLAEEEWIKKLTSEFSDVDNFELAVE